MENKIISRQFASGFRKLLYKWGKSNNKKYPWRYIDDAYKVLISELMLQRTRAYQVVPIYDDFIETYPDLHSTGKAKQVELEKILHPLGLNWRIRNMINILNTLQRTYNSMPETYNQLIKIQGIGPYIAGATICFSQNKPFVLIDTNIVKVVCRVNGLNLEGEARRRKSTYQTIELLVDKKRPRVFYYSIIDLSHLICLNKEPNCMDCPLKILPCKFAEKIFLS